MLLQTPKIMNILFCILCKDYYNNESTTQVKSQDSITYMYIQALLKTVMTNICINVYIMRRCQKCLLCYLYTHYESLYFTVYKYLNIHQTILSTGVLEADINRHPLAIYRSHMNANLPGYFLLLMISSKQCITYNMT